jgi:3-methyladenine DNA glycosylase AlkC
MAKNASRTEIKISREKTKIDIKSSKNEQNVEKQQRKIEKLTKDLSLQKELVKQHSEEILTLKRAGRSSDTELLALRKMSEEHEVLKIEHAKLLKELKKSQAEVVTISESYQKEMLLRKKYYNIIEDMKGRDWP